MKILLCMFLIYFIPLVLIVTFGMVHIINKSFNANKANKLSEKARKRIIKKERKKIKNQIKRVARKGNVFIINNSITKENDEYFKDLGFKIRYNNTIPFVYLSWKE